jgi:CrcB protein
VTPAVWVAVALLGGLGALARWVVDGRVSAHVHHGFPYGILAVNLSGAFALGLVAGAGLDGDARRLAATGLLGAYTTFSTWMLDSDRLWLQRHRAAAVVNVAGSLALGLAAVWLGRQLA